MDPIVQPKNKNKKVITWFIIAVVSTLVILWAVFGQPNFSSKIKGFETATNNFFVQTIHSDTLLPPPLRGVFGTARDPLTLSGVLNWTNSNRGNNNLPDLTINETLNQMAEAKLQDMFSKQYFEHESPTGVGPGELAKQIGYDYIVIGENLALGTFDGDKALLDAWMASPGHRANILNTRYKEIGIAVGQGTFEGKTTWLAVQEFGLPITACPQPSTTDKASIDKMKKDVTASEAALTAAKNEIDNYSPKYGDDYNAKVSAYNDLVHKYNALVTALKNKISDYNKQVATFNSCAELSMTKSSTVAEAHQSF